MNVRDTRAMAAQDEHPKQRQVPAEIRNATFPVGVRGYDMFPQTAHVETLCELEPARP